MMRPALVALGLLSCGAPMLVAAPKQQTPIEVDTSARCPEICGSAAAQLERDFGVEPGVIVCSVREVQQATSCAECAQYFLRFGVRFTPSCD